MSTSERCEEADIEARKESKVTQALDFAPVFHFLNWRKGINGVSTVEAN